jgi:hypothetical protein
MNRPRQGGFNQNGSKGAASPARLNLVLTMKLLTAATLAAEAKAAKERDRQAYRERGWPSG